MRIYEYAKQVKLPAKTIMDLLAKGGFKAATHFVALTDEMRAYLEKELSKQAPPAAKPVKAFSAHPEPVEGREKKTTMPVKETAVKPEAPHKAPEPATAVKQAHAAPAKPSM